MSARAALWAAQARYMWQALGAAGRAGVLCVAAAVALLAFARVALDPAIEREREREAQARWDAERGLAAARRGATPQATLDSFVALLPGTDALAAAIEAIHAAADRERLAIERGDYRVTRDLGGRAQRHVLLLPVRGAYTDLHGWLQHVLHRHPFIALDELDVRRAAGDEAMVEARVQFSLYSRGER
jgi:hypothetical protein